jgi:hypothetical protein
MYKNIILHLFAVEYHEAVKISVVDPDPVPAFLEIPDPDMVWIWIQGFGDQKL